MTWRKQGPSGITMVWDNRVRKGKASSSPLVEALPIRGFRLFVLFNTYALDAVTQHWSALAFALKKKWQDQYS